MYIRWCYSIQRTMFGNNSMQMPTSPHHHSFSMTISIGVLLASRALQTYVHFGLLLFTAACTPHTTHLTLLCGVRYVHVHGIQATVKGGRLKCVYLHNQPAYGITVQRYIQRSHLQTSSQCELQEQGLKCNFKTATHASTKERKMAS